jgi:hypothetical protein
MQGIEEIAISNKKKSSLVSIAMNYLRHVSP